jgi:hypothetical protein
MAVTLKFISRGPRGIAFDREVRAIAPEIIRRQASGIIIARDVAKSLNDDGVPKANGASWSEAVVFRMLRRGSELGLPFCRRSRNEAASLRRVLRRSQDEIASERRADLGRLLAILRKADTQSDSAITARDKPAFQRVSDKARQEPIQLGSSDDAGI